MGTQTNYYATKDISEGAALLVNQQHLTKIERKGKVCYFVFEDAQKCSKISNEFFFGELMVNARDYYQAITRLKNRIFAGR